MSNVMAMKNLRNKVSRNGFDLSERRSLTGKVGEILPVFTLETLPGDVINLNPEHFTRTMPLNTAAYSQIKEYMHFYFVPYRLLHSGLDSFFSDNHENATRAGSISQAQRINGLLPYFTYKDVAEYIRACVKKDVKGQTGYKHAYTTVKLLEYLGYGDFSRFLTEDIGVISSDVNIRMSPLPLLAYQKIYQDHFRNKQWEKTSPETSNMDYAPFGSALPILTALGNSYTQGQFVNDMFSLRYCDYNKDYFFGLLPNAQYGDSATFPVVPVGYDGRSVDGFGSDTYANSSFSSVSDHVQGFNASVIAMRKAEALQKYREIIQSGERSYESFIEKIFNVGVSEDRSDQCRYLGGYDSSVNISEVVNTNLAEADAEIKGKGISSGGSRNIHFECKEFGIIIGVYTSRPSLEYALNAPSKAVLRVSSDDFANPVFDKIGMQTVSIAEVGMPYELRQKSGAVRVSANIGYAPRYYDYKTSYDKVMGEFKHSLKSWVSPLTTDTIYGGFIDEEYGAEIMKRLTYLSFKVNPNVMNSVFKHEVTDTTETDQLWIKVGIGCPVVRNLDYDGLPY